MTRQIGCLWCGRAFQPRRGGSPQRFCSAEHRVAFHSTGRRWAENAVALGKLTIADLKADPAACTLVSGAISPATAPEEGDEDNVLAALLGDILDAVSPDELAGLPEPVFALLEFIAGRDAGGPDA